MGNSLKLCSDYHIRALFNVNLSRAHYDLHAPMFSAQVDIVGNFLTFEGRPLYA